MNNKYIKEIFKESAVGAIESEWDPPTHLIRYQFLLCIIKLSRKIYMEA